MPKQKKQPVSIYQIEGRLSRQKVMLELDEVRQRRKAVPRRTNEMERLRRDIAALTDEIAELRRRLEPVLRSLGRPGKPNASRPRNAARSARDRTSVVAAKARIGLPQVDSSSQLHGRT